MSSNSYPEEKQEEKVSSNTTLNNNILQKSMLKGTSSGSIDDDANSEKLSVNIITTEKLANCEVSIKKSTGEELLKQINDNHNSAKAEYKANKDKLVAKTKLQLDQLQANADEENTKERQLYKEKKSELKKGVSKILNEDDQNIKSSDTAESDANYSKVITDINNLKKIKESFKLLMKNKKAELDKKLNEINKLNDNDVNELRNTYKAKRNEPLLNLNYECRIYVSSKGDSSTKYFGSNKSYYTGAIVEIYPNENAGVKVKLGREIFSVQFSNVCINSETSSVNNSTSSDTSIVKTNDNANTPNEPVNDEGNDKQEGGAYYNPYNPYNQYSSIGSISTPVEENEHSSPTSAFSSQADQDLSFSQTSSFQKE